MQTLSWVREQIDRIKIPQMHINLFTNGEDVSSFLQFNQTFKREYIIHQLEKIQTECRPIPTDLIKEIIKYYL